MSKGGGVYPALSGSTTKKTINFDFCFFPNSAVNCLSCSISFLSLNSESAVEGRVVVVLSKQQVLCN